MLDTLPPELILAVLVDCGGSLTIRDLFTVRRLSKSLKSAAMEALRQRFTLFRKERFESNTYGPFEEAQALLGRLGNAQVEAASMIRYLSILGESWSTCFVFSNHLLTPVEAGESLMRCFTTEELLVTMVEFAWTLLPWDNEAEDEYVTVGAPHPFFYVGLIRGSVGFNGPPSPFNAKNDRVDKQGCSREMKKVATGRRSCQRSHARLHFVVGETPRPCFGN